jgi:hypothetical protein
VANLITKEKKHNKVEQQFWWILNPCGNTLDGMDGDNKES